MIDPFFGKVTCNGHVVGKKCTFTCDTGYQLSGPHERTCETSGKWSGRESKCLRTFFVIICVCYFCGIVVFNLVLVVVVVVLVVVLLLLLF